VYGEESHDICSLKEDVYREWKWSFKVAAPALDMDEVVVVLSERSRSDDSFIAIHRRFHSVLDDILTR